MKFEHLIHRVESRLAELFDDAQDELREQAAALAAAVARHEEALEAARARRDEAALRLERNTQAVALLPSSIEDSVRRGKSAQAMRQALELERLRREMAEDRAELPRLEQAIWSLSFRLRQLRRQLARLKAEQQRPPRR
jgi:chromosome segregation ATPase